MGKARDLRYMLDEGVLEMRARQRPIDAIKNALGVLMLGLFLTPFILVPVGVIVLVIRQGDISESGVVGISMGCWLAGVAFVGGRQTSERDALARAIDRVLER